MYGHPPKTADRKDVEKRARSMLEGAREKRSEPRAQIDALRSAFHPATPTHNHIGSLRHCPLM